MEIKSDWMLICLTFVMKSPSNSGRKKISQSNLVTFLTTYWNLFKSESLSTDPLLLPWQHFLERALRKDRVLQNSNDVTVTSFLNWFQHNFATMLEILGCTFVTNLSKIGWFMFPWQHILETVLMQNWATLSVITSLWRYFLISLHKI